jgi:hypothetical protein
LITGEKPTTGGVGRRRGEGRVAVVAALSPPRHHLPVVPHHRVSRRTSLLAIPDGNTAPGQKWDGKAGIG